MTDAVQLFESAIRWLRDHYTDYRFFAERDLVWTVQRRIADEIARTGAPLRVFNDHTILPGIRSDLVILAGNAIQVAAEFKYEPSHQRRADRGGDIWPTKLNPSVVFWTGDGSVQKDTRRVVRFVDRKQTPVAYSVFVDEGGFFRRRASFPGSQWRDWDDAVSVLWSKVSRGVEISSPTTSGCSGAGLAAPDPILALRGFGRRLWEDGDAYVRRLREGWS